jgi:hypothetical protein
MKRFLLLFVVSALTLGFWSCEEDAEDPKFIGSWVQTSTEEGTEMKDVLDLTASTFQSVYSMKMGEEWFELGGGKGTLTTSGNELTLTFTHAGSAEYDFETHTLGDLVWYGAGTEEFDATIAEMGGDATLKGEYSVSGETLTLKIDVNGDGSYDNDEETSVYTKI